MEKSYEELQTIMKESSGTEHYYEMNPFTKNFLVTEGIRGFIREAKALWLIDLVASYMPKIDKVDDSFFVPLITVNEDREGKFQIYREVSGRKTTVVEQDIFYADLPAGKYKFFLCRDGQYFVMMCPSEY